MTVPKRRTVGIRALKDEASAIVRRVRGGEVFTITDRGEPVALLVPLHGLREEETLHHLAAAGRVAWSGGKPTGSAKPPRVLGPTMAAVVVEDRR